MLHLFDLYSGLCILKELGIQIPKKGVQAPKQKPFSHCKQYHSCDHSFLYPILHSTHSMLTPPLSLTCRCEVSPAESRMSLHTAGGSVPAQNSHSVLHAEPYMLDCCIYWCPLRKRAPPSGSPSSCCLTSPYSMSSPHACGIWDILASC